MTVLGREISRALRSLPVEASVRWHAWRLRRCSDLQHRHSAALDTAMARVRGLLNS